VWCDARSGRQVFMRAVAPEMEMAHVHVALLLDGTVFL
jgi:hypothetical protein